MTLKEYAESRKKGVSAGCTGCACKACLYWWSKRCPYGKCWDDYRADKEPYNKLHSNEPPRMGWSSWNKPGEQEHWCRGGMFYPVRHCRNFIKYKGQQVQECLKANVSVFQDGYVLCSIIDIIGCEKCWEEKGGYGSEYIPSNEWVFHPKSCGVYKAEYVGEGVWRYSDEHSDWIYCDGKLGRDLGVIYNTVTAWQSLPEPYKGE